jgi:transketolase N-terminal domain/subunit
MVLQAAILADLWIAQIFYGDLFQNHPTQSSVHYGWHPRRSFSLSNGPISPVFYASLARAGYFDIKELSNFRKINTPLPKNIFQEAEMSMVHLVRA